MRLVPGGDAEAMAAAVGTILGITPVERELERFPDGEVRVRVHDDLRDEDVYLVQSTGPPVQQHLVELLLLADALDRAGAARITVLSPYLAYARQDRRTAPGDAVALRVVADLLSASAVDRLVVVDPHTPELEAIFGIDVEIVSAFPWLADEARDRLGDRPAVVVAPDLGAVKIAERFAERLGAPIAIVRKSRVSGAEVETSGVVGDVTGRVPILVDDMISTGGTIAAAVDALQLTQDAPRPLVVAAHGLLVPPADERLGDGLLDAIVVTDSVTPGVTSLPVHTVGLAPLLAEVVRRLAGGEPLGELALYR